MSGNIGKFVLLEESECSTKTIVHKTWLSPSGQNFFWPPGSEINAMNLVGEEKKPEKEWSLLPYTRIIHSSGKLFHII